MAMNSCTDVLHFGHQCVADATLLSIFRSSGPSVYMRQQTRTSLVQIMAWRLFGAKPLSEPMLEYCYLNPLEQTSMKYLW